jgi:hypothetical protein
MKQWSRKREKFRQRPSLQQPNQHLYRMPLALLKRRKV